MDSISKPTSRKLVCIEGFTGDIRKKVHRLFYHSLCTNVAEKEGFEVPEAALHARGCPHSLPQLALRNCSGMTWVQIPRIKIQPTMIGWTVFLWKTA